MWLFGLQALQQSLYFCQRFFLRKWNLLWRLNQCVVLVRWWFIVDYAAHLQLIWYWRFHFAQVRLRVCDLYLFILYPVVSTVLLDLYRINLRLILRRIYFFKEICKFLVIKWCEVHNIHEGTIQIIFDLLIFLAAVHDQVIQQIL